MPKVSPLPSDEIETSSTSDLLENLVPQEMDNNAVATTSFSAAQHPNYASVTTNEEPDNIQDDGMRRNQSQNFQNGMSARIDSIRSINQEARWEPIDFTELSLHQIARDGNVLQMQNAFLQMDNPNVIKRKLNKRDRDKFTPLHYAARYNHFEMCQLLLEKGSYIHAIGDDKLTPLHLVAKYKPKKEKLYGSGDGDRSDLSGEDDNAEQQEKNIKVLNFLLEKGARVNEKDFYDLTPLHHACLRGNDACVEKLLQCREISVEAVDKQLMTPLHMCSVYGNVSIAKRLIDYGANIRCKDTDDGTPLQYAAAEGNLEIVELMFNQSEKGSQTTLLELLEEKDSDGSTSLHLAVDNGHLHVTKFIIEQSQKCGYDINAARSDRETALHIAAKHGYIEIVKLLVENKAKVNARNDSLQSPLFMAARFNHHKVVEYLIKQRANIELHDSDSYTALLIAASYGHPETISVLLHERANVLAVDKDDKNIIFICAEENRVDSLTVLLERKKVRSLLEGTDRHDNTPLHVAALNGHIAVVKVLLEKGALTDPKNEDEQTPLHMAADKGWVKIVKVLITSKNEIVHDDDEDGNTALHLAALSGRIQCVGELVRRGADTGARNTKQWTPLDCCASAGMHKSAVVLLEADAPVDAKDKRKQTPLHLACVHGHDKMVEMLLEWGADVAHRAVSGKNALDFAIEFGQTDCALAIINSDHWREALQNRTRDYKTEMHVDTPMRKLIRKMPDVAIEVFRKCLRDNEKNKDDKQYAISFDYEFLDDEFSCAGWFDDPGTETVNVMGSPQHSKAQTQSDEVYDHNGKVLASAKPYTTDSSLLMKNHPLMVMVKSQRVNLLRHPLVVSLLNHKWRSYGRMVYYINLIVYVLFLAVLNSYALTIPPPYAVNFTATPSASPCAVIRDEAQAVWGAECLPRSQWQSVATWIVIVLAGINILKELYQILSQRFGYVRSLTNIIEITTYALSILLVIDVSELGRNSGIREVWQWQCGAAAIFLSWMGLLLFIQNFPKFGIFVLMFSDVFQTFLQFFAVFALFIFGFAFSFHVLLQNQFAFNFWWNSIVKTFVMMIGEFEYDGIFNEQFMTSGYTNELQYEAITYILFVIFMIIMSIIIMNLLVGLAVDDIKEVQNNAVLESLAMQVKLALDIEYTLPKWLRKRFMMQRRSFSPNRYRKSDWFTRWRHSEQHLNVTTIDEALNPEKTDLEKMEDKIDKLQRKVRGVRQVMHNMNNRSRQVENITQAIAAHFKIDWENSEDDEDLN